MSDKETGIVRSDSQGLMQLIQAASLNPEVDAAKLAALLDVKLRWEADEARKQFHAAFAQFKGEVPRIVKTAAITVNNQTRGKYAPLDEVCDKLIPAMARSGLSHRWVTKDSPDSISVTCFLKGFGHEEEGASLSGPPDSSGSKNPIQARMSTVTYLERYTLLASCGVAVYGTDDDGNGGHKKEPMDEKEFAGLMEAIESADSEKSLKDAFFKAAKRAREIGDSGALKSFEAAKNETWRQNGGWR